MAVYRTSVSAGGHGRDSWRPEVRTTWKLLPG